MPDVLFAEVARRIPGSDPANNPQPDSVAEFFAGTRVDLSFDSAVASAREWRPDVIICDAVDFVGPLVAAALGVPSAIVAFGPAVPEEFIQPMVEVVADRYVRRGLVPGTPLAVLDPTPPMLQAPGWLAGPTSIPFRGAPHTRPGAPGAPVWPRDHELDPRVLVTLGTVFGDEDLLRDIIDSIDTTRHHVIATVGAANGTVDQGPVRYVPFHPMADLLTGTDVVVSAGGAGTVLGALSQGIPLVLLPQGADQFINAERAADAGAAIVVQTPKDVGSAIARILNEPSFRQAAQRIRDQNARRPEPAAAVVALLSRVGAREN
jgi:UDP:flavonoid glycosyltransferase YjiC (YdhE family)